jgi:UV DNA damage endonuclease
MMKSEVIWKMSDHLTKDVTYEMENTRVTILSNPHIKFFELEKEWARYKYLILEHDPLVYQNIRRILNDKTEAPAIEFYRLVDKALAHEIDVGMAINAYQHVAGYFRDHWDKERKASFGGMLEDYRIGKITRMDIKGNLKSEAILYQVDYLIDSYFFDV